MKQFIFNVFTCILFMLSVFLIVKYCEHEDFMFLLGAAIAIGIRDALNEIRYDR